MNKQRAMYLVYRIFDLMAEERIWKDVAISKLVDDGVITDNERAKLNSHFNCPFYVYTGFNCITSTDIYNCPKCPGLELWERGKCTKVDWVQCEAYTKSPWVLLLNAYNDYNMKKMAKYARVISEWAKSNLTKEVIE